MVTIICQQDRPERGRHLFDLPLTDFNIRWYHVYSTIAFVVANLWNFQLNRAWTFRSAKHSGWFREYCRSWPSAARSLIGLDILTLLMHPGSLLAVADLLRQLQRVPDPALLGAADHHRVVTPVSFVLNKLWTFSAVRGQNCVAGVGRRARAGARHTPSEPGQPHGRTRPLVDAPGDRRTTLSYE